MKRLILTVCLLLLAGPAWAQGILIVNGGLIDNEYIFGLNAASPHTPTVTKTLGATHKSLFGLGQAESVIRFPADGTVTTRAVWLGAAATRGRVQGLEIDGQYDVGQGSLTSVTDIAHGVESDAGAAYVNDCYIHGFRGAGVVMDVGQFVRNNTIEACLSGIKLTTSDCMVTGNYVLDCRDYGLHVATNAGNNYSAGNHFYGCNNGNVAAPATSTGGAACRVDSAVFFRGEGDSYGDSYHGIESYGAACEWVNCHIFQNFHRGVYFGQNGQGLSDCTIQGMVASNEFPNTVAVEFGAERCSMYGGRIEMTSYIGNKTGPAASEALRIAGAADNPSDACRVTTRVHDGDGINGTKCLRITRPIVGGEFHIYTYDFHQSSDRLLVVDSAAISGNNSIGSTGMRGVTIHFYGLPTGSYATKTNYDLANPGKYIDIPVNWDSSNTIVLHNLSTGASLTLTAGTAY